MFKFLKKGTAAALALLLPCFELVPLFPDSFFQAPPCIMQTYAADTENTADTVAAEAPEALTFEDFTYTVSADGNVTITKYSGSAESLEIPQTIDQKPVTAIGDAVFRKNTALQTVTFPSTLSAIGHYTFEGCTKLSDVTLPETLTSIGQNAFNGCSALTEITLPDALTSIDYRAFYGTGLTSIAIPASVTYAYQPFDGTAVSKVTFAEGITEIPHYAFAGCTKLSDVTLPETLTSIGQNAFNGCSALTEITLPDSITSIDYRAFCGTGLTSIEIPVSVTYAYQPFEGTSLAEVTFAEGRTSIPETMFAGCFKLEKINFAKSMTTIGAKAFQNCTALTELVIPEGITTIGHYAFENCTKLSDVTFPETLTSIGQNAFNGCSALTEITLPDSITSIDYRAFCGTGLTSIEIPVSVTYAYQPFEGTSLAEVTFAEGRTSIPETMFAGCSKLEKINFAKSMTTIGAKAFQNCTALTDLVIPEGITTIGQNTFNGCSALTEITLPDSLKSIDYRAFSNTGLTSIEIPASVNDTFQPFEYTHLTEATFKDGCTIVPDTIFSGCTELTTVNLPDTVKSIDRQAFKGCTKLSAVNSSRKVIPYTPDSFTDCISLHDERFTVLKSTSCVVANADSSGINDIVNFTVRYDLFANVKDKVDANYVEVILSNGLVLLPDTVSSDVLDSERSNFRTNIFAMTEPSGVLHFSCRVTEYGTQSLRANLRFNMDGMGWNEIIGIVDVEAPKLTCQANDLTDSFSAEVYGLSAKNTEVSIFVDGKAAGKVTTNQYTGKYTLNVPLPTKKSGESYQIHAESGDTVTNDVTVTYQEEQPVLRKVWLANNTSGKYLRDITSAFTNGTIPVISISPYHPIIFQVEVTHPEKVEYVEITSKRGTEIATSNAYWDEERQMFCTDGRFDNNYGYIPGLLSLRIVEKQMLVFNSETEYAEAEQALAIPEETINQFEYEVLENQEDLAVIDISLADSGEKAFRYYAVENDEMNYNGKTYSKEEVAKNPVQFGFREVSSVDKGEQVVHIYAQMENQDEIFQSADIMGTLQDYSGEMESILSGTKIFEVIENKAYGDGTSDTIAGQMMTSMLSSYSNKLVMDAVGSSVGDVLGGFDGVFAKYSAGFGVAGDALSFVDRCFATDDPRILNASTNLLVAQMGVAAVGVMCASPYVLAGCFVAGCLLDVGEGWLDDCISNGTYTSFLRWLIDPSGIVYEAVIDNPLEGAKLTVYYQDPDTKETVLWNAEDYDQTSTLYSLEDGRYAWDVPEGLWKVVCEMDGYDTMESEWVPVPPVQTEINFAMVSHDAPTMETAEWAGTALNVTFTKYMQDETVTADTLKVTKDGKALKYTITPVKSEQNTTEFSKTYTVTFDAESFPNGSLDVQLTTGAKSYADTAAKAAKQSVNAVIPMDVNGDAEVTMADAILLSKILAEDAAYDQATYLMADVNKDSVVTMLDLSLLLGSLKAERK